MSGGEARARGRAGACWGWAGELLGQAGGGTVADWDVWGKVFTAILPLVCPPTHPPTPHPRRYASVPEVTLCLGDSLTFVWPSDKKNPQGVVRLNNLGICPRVNKDWSMNSQVGGWACVGRLVS